jgi:hypothetical protein
MRRREFITLLGGLPSNQETPRLLKMRLEMGEWPTGSKMMNTFRKVWFALLTVLAAVIILNVPATAQRLFVTAALCIVAVPLSGGQVGNQSALPQAGRRASLFQPDLLDDD